MKAYTDLEQSQKLAEFLPIESADMYYEKGIGDNYRVDFGNYADISISKNLLYIDAIPCWSLTALRNLLPIGIKINENTYLFESHNTFDKSWVYRYYNEDDTSYLYYNDTSEIDACVAMIEKLHELNLL